MKSFFINFFSFFLYIPLIFSVQIIFNLNTSIELNEILKFSIKWFLIISIPILIIEIIYSSILYLKRKNKENDSIIFKYKYGIFPFVALLFLILYIYTVTPRIELESLIILVFIVLLGEFLRTRIRNKILYGKFF